MKVAILLALVCAAFAYRKVQNKGALCDFCLKFVSGIENFLENEEGPIEEYGEKLCDELTLGNAFLDPICKQLVDTELPKIVEWIEANEKPETVCGYLHLC